MNQKKVVFIAVVVIVSVLFLSHFIPVLFHFPVIGTISGADNEYLMIDGVKYLDESMLEGYEDITIADRGEYIGSVSNGNTKMRVFTVKGHEDYLYVLWDWEGRIYIHTEQ